MEIQQLKYFLVLIHEMSFTEAAEELYISQSALSKQIKALERELDVMLLDRTTRRISLTQAGEDFKIYAEQIVNDYDQMLANMSRHVRNVKRKLTIAATQQLTNYGLTDLILSFGMANPTLELVVTELEPKAIAKEVRNGSADMGILYREYMQDSNFNHVPIYNDRLVVVASKTHPLARQDVVRIEQLKEETLLFIRALDLDFKDIIAECSKRGFVPDISPSNLRLNSMERFIVSNNCIGIMPQIQVHSFDNPNVLYVDLEVNIPRTLCFIVAEDKRSEATHTFVQYILDNFHSKTFA